MQVSNSVATPSTAIPPTPAPATAPPSTAPATSPSALASPSTTSTATGSGSSPSDVWSSDAVTQALQAVNDTSGKTSLSDQLTSYDYLMNLMTGGGTGGGVPGGSDRIAVWNSVAQSPFAQQVSQAQNTYSQNSAVPHGAAGSALIQKQINSFNSLTSKQQTILVDQMNQNKLSLSYSVGKTAFASVSSFQSYQQTQLSVQQAIESAFASDALTNATLTNPASIKDPKLSALVQVANQNGISDAWATQAQAALSAYSTTSISAKPAVTVTLSDSAKAALASSSTNTSTSTSTTEVGAEKALNTLTSTTYGATKADAALTILQNGAAARANLNSDSFGSADANGSTGNRAAIEKPYTAGSRLSASV